MKGFESDGFKTQVQPLSHFQDAYGLEVDGQQQEQQEEEEEEEAEEEKEKEEEAEEEEEEEEEEEDEDDFDETGADDAESKSEEGG